MIFSSETQAYASEQIACKICIVLSIAKLVRKVFLQVMRNENGRTSIAL